MSSLQAKISPILSDPEALETLFQEVKTSGQFEAFSNVITSYHRQKPTNLLVHAWYVRLHPKSSPSSISLAISWPLALQISLVVSTILWFISADSFSIMPNLPAAFWLWGPLVSLGVLGYVALTTHKYLRTALLMAIFLPLVVAFVFLISSTQFLLYQDQYLGLMLIELPLLAWIVLAFYLLRPKASFSDRFAFLSLSLTLFITTGLCLAIGFFFIQATLALFQTIAVSLPPSLVRFLVTGTVSSSVIITTALVYNPRRTPTNQDVAHGIRPLLVTFMRLFLPLVILVLAFFTFTAPFHFLVPYQNRQVLIMQNIIIFALIALTIGVIPSDTEKLTLRIKTWLRRGVVVVVGLTTLFSLYALSAVIYRTQLDGFTPNRVTIIGWNLINTLVTGSIFISQLRQSAKTWVIALKTQIAHAITWWALWIFAQILLIPLIFR